jgi:uracil-DNA glycosylase family 4
MPGSARKHPLAKCEECPLAETGRYVPTTFPVSGKADLAFVGEAPGLQEAKTGRPFMGPSGDLLNTVIRHHRINRRDVVLTNACSCRPPDNSTPPALAIKACNDRLIAELGHADVKTAVALGNSAAQALTGRSGVTKLRLGPGIPSRFDPDLRVITTLHPAYCLRNPDGFPSLVVDVGKAINPGVHFIPPTYTVVHTPAEAIRLSRKLLGGSGPLVVDIETHVEKDVGFDHPNQYGMLCVGIGKRAEGYFVLAETALNKRSYRALGILLRRRGSTCQNGKFDHAGLYSHTGPFPLKFDTMLASYVFDERPGIHGLKGQAAEYLGAPDYDKEIAKYNPKSLGYGVIPRKILYKYNAYDIYCTDLLQEMYERRFSHDPDARRVHDFLVEASQELMYLELNGLAVDAEYIRTLEKMYQESLGVLEDQLDEIVAASKATASAINPRSPQQVKKALHEMGIKTASTDEEHIHKILDYIKGLAEKKNKEPEEFAIYRFCTTLLVHRKETKMYGTYVKGTRKRMYRGRVYPTFLLHGTTSGRLSCRNPNLQNVPRGSAIRNLFVPAREGNVFVQSDYSQAELRVLTFLSGCIYFRDIFNAGDVDLFDELTPVLYPRIGAKNTIHPQEWKEFRIRIKAFVYGLGYGRGHTSIADEFKIPHHEGLALKKNFFSVIPEVVSWQKEVQTKVAEGHDLKTPFGRTRQFPLITKQNWHEIQKEALAFLPQSTSSDICLGAMVHVRRDLKGKAWIRNIVHDSILAECRAEDAEATASHMDRRMLESAYAIVGDYVRFATDYKIGMSWGEV